MVGYEEFKSSCACFPLTGVSLIKVTGEDRLDWLQGQATNDMRMLTESGSISFCFCTATGQPVARLDAWAKGDSIYISVENACIEAVLERFNKMVILEDIEAENLTETLTGWSIQGPRAVESLERLKPSVPPGTLLFESNRAGGGIDVWFSESLDLTGIPVASQEAIELRRLVNGIPAWGKDMNAKTLPPELGKDFEAKHISYRKGCYLGQEVLMRIYSRGHTNKTWVAIQSDMMLEPSAKVYAGQTVAGQVNYCLSSPEHGFLSSMNLRNEFLINGMALQVESGTEVIVRTLPLA